MDVGKRNAALLGLAGLVLLVLGAKALPGWLADAEPPGASENQPVVLFFNDTDPCDCMQELVHSANRQMADWQNDGSAGDIQVMHIGMHERTDLEAKYRVFRAPCLVLVNGQGGVTWRQDYPLIEGGPFKLDELEQAIANLEAEMRR